MRERGGLYFLLAAIGLVSQVSIVAYFFADSGFDLAEFGEQAVESTIAVLVLADLIMCGLVYLVWSRFEARRVGLDPWWPFAVAVMGGVCFAFPLFLGYRERKLARGPAGAPAGAGAVA